jgi:hypothetical protein
MLDWLVHEQGVEPHIPVWDKSTREDGTFSRSDFAYDHAADAYTCPAGKVLVPRRRAFSKPRGNAPKDDTYRYRATKADCGPCPLKPSCCPNTPARKVTRSIYEGARDFARDIAKTDAYVTSGRERKKVEMLFAHLKRILRLERLRLRGPCGARDEFLLAATAQNLRKLAKLIPMPAPAGRAAQCHRQPSRARNTDFFNTIRPNRTSGRFRAADHRIDRVRAQAGLSTVRPRGRGAPKPELGELPESGCTVPRPGSRWGAPTSSYRPRSEQRVF